MSKILQYYPYGVLCLFGIRKPLRRMFSSCVCSTHETVCKFNYILCERKASRQCEKTGDTLDCFDICKRSCTDCMQRVFRQCAAACVS